MQAGTAVGNLASAIGITTEDASLVADLKAGSEEAFGLLIAQYHQPLYSLIARSINDPADASDITQEVFIKVFRSIRGFNGDASLRTWLYRIALHEASNQRRWWSRHKRQEVTIDSSYDADADESGDSLCLSATLADQGDSPYDQAVQKESREHLEAALRELPEAYRAVVVLREIEGFAYEEIADILDVQLGTVKSRLTRGRTALRSLLIAQSTAAKTSSRTTTPNQSLSSASSASSLSLQSSKGAATR
ncbi:MAG: polymerase, sigma-24 subunit, subfamily [Acidobacteriaceae bacterium]|nr:polymerase, sigma-24 subunit, subfamily [Acidobacteriaceae bacterium]